MSMRRVLPSIRTCTVQTLRPEAWIRSLLKRYLANFGAENADDENDDRIGGGGGLFRRSQARARIGRRHRGAVDLRDDGLPVGGEGTPRRPNLSGPARSYLERLGANLEDLFHHVIATLHESNYHQLNAGALRAEGPRIPLPGWPDGDSETAAQTLARSAARGGELARLLDPDTPVAGVTQGILRPEIAAIAVPATIDGGNMTGDGFALTAGWGHFGTGDAVMPGQGRIVEREYTPDERAALGEAISALGTRTLDVYLNDRAYWRNVPTAVWTYKLGGYQVLKKWLSYRERDVLGRVLKLEEIQHFTDTARRIGAMLVELGSNVLSYR